MATAHSSTVAGVDVAVEVPDIWSDDHALETTTDTLVSLIRAVGAHHSSLAALAAEIDVADPRPEILTHAVAVRVADPPERQRILETPHVSERVILVSDLLATVLADLAGPGTIH